MRTINLKNFVHTLESGKKPKGGVTEEGIPIIGSEHIEWSGMFNFERLKYVPEAHFGQLNGGIIQHGDVLVVKDGVAMGKTAYVDETFPYSNACINEHVFLLRMKEGLNAKYLHYYFLSSEGRGKIIENFRRATTYRNFLDMDIPLPPLEEQREIVMKLDSLNQLNDKRYRANKMIQHYLLSVFYEMFGDPFTNPKAWKLAQIGDMTSYTQYGTSRKASEESAAFKILRMNNITYEGDWDLKSLKYIELDEKEKSKYLVHKGEMLFNRTNSKELVGKTAVYRESESMAFASYLVKLVPNERGHAEFISAFLNSPHGKELLLSRAKSIDGRANINAEELKTIPIYMPPIELQNRYGAIVESVEALKKKQRKSADLVAQLLQNTLNQSFGRGLSHA